MNCKQCQSELATLLFNEPSAKLSPAVSALQAHIADCHACARELNALKRTMSVLDEWHAPEPTPFFDTRLHARLREEIAAAPAGFFERLRSRLLFNTNAQFRPVMAGAMALLFIVGGSGSYMALHTAQPMELSATVQDLQIIDKNEQALNQMDQLLDEDPGDNNSQSSGQVNP